MRDEMIELWRNSSRKYNYLHFLHNATHPQPYCSSPPHQVYIEPTNRCNLRCKHCPQHTMRREIQVMDLGLFERIVMELAPHMPFIDLYLQGEGLLHPNIVEMVKICRANGLLPRSTTNCYPLTRKKARQLIEAGLDKIEFSMSGASKKTYDKIYVGGKYETALTNMMNFLEENAAAGFPVHTRSVFVEEEATMSEKGKYLRMFAKLPLDDVYVSPLINMFGWNDEMDLSEHKKKPKNEWPMCKSPWRQIGINADGTVRACIFDYDSRYLLGDANKESIMDIWNGERMQAFRKAIIERRYEDLEEPGLPLCTECSQIWPTSDLPDTTQLPVDFTVEAERFLNDERDSFKARYADRVEKEEKAVFLEHHREEWFAHVLADVERS